MKSHGVRNGVSLDGGASTCFYYNGSYLIQPQRKLCNMLVVSQKL
jgi:exopolysaccharide biosynthesis protein